MAKKFKARLDPDASACLMRRRFLGNHEETLDIYEAQY